MPCVGPSKCRDGRLTRAALHGDERVLALRCVRTGARVSSCGNSLAERRAAYGVLMVKDEDWAETMAAKAAMTAMGDANLMMSGKERKLRD